MTSSNSPTPSSDGAKAGSVPTLDVFALRDSVVDEYKRFATSFTTIHAEDVREQVAAIYAENRYWPEPLIQINPSYKRTTDVSAQVANGVLHPGCGDIFRADGQPLSLYKHQEQAVALAAEGESFVMTTGTGSGKSLCFFIPIVSHALAARRTNVQRRTQAVVVYPMNALANSQMEELSKFWDPDRRFRLRCEIEAAFFHFYGISRDDTLTFSKRFRLSSGRRDASTANTGRSEWSWRPTMPWRPLLRGACRTTRRSAHRGG